MTGTTGFRSGRVLGLLILVAALVLASALPGVHALLTRLLEAARHVMADHPVGGAVLFAGLAALSAMLAFFSSAVLVPAGIGVWGPVGCGVLLWVGWLVGGATSYALARWLGRPVLRRVVAGRRVAEYEDLVSHRTPFAVVLLVQLALPSEIPGYALGLAGYPAGRYLAALALVELPYAAGVVAMGESFLERRIVPLLGLGLLAAAVAVLSARALHRRRTRAST